jgi:glutathione peroxidase
MSVYDFKAVSLAGEMIDLADYKGKVLLIVNTASDCGFTNQYEGLEKLYKEYQDQGLVVLGFPCNQFGEQEKADDAEIGAFCQKNYGVNFPMFSKIDVNGGDAAPLFNWLKEKAPGLLGSKKIKWNFTKFLVTCDGESVTRYASATKPEKISKDIEKALANAK